MISCRPVKSGNSDFAGPACAFRDSALHARMTAWREELNAEEWHRLRVVVVGGAMPRRDCLGVQYFSRLLGVDGECRRVMYAEGTLNEDQALQLAATHRLARTIAATVFHDPNRMHRDLMSDVAREHLSEFRF